MPSITKENKSSTTLKKEAQKRFDRMKEEMAQYVASWQDIQRYIVPTRGQFNDAKPVRGKMIDHKTLVDSHATNANRILASGLNSGMTSKSRPWFKLTLSDVIMLEIPGAKEWLDEVQKRMYTILDKSNLYGIFQSTYEELGAFATGCFCLLPDFEDVVRGRNYTAGEYYLGTDSKGRVNSFARTFWMTVGQLVEEFGYESCSTNVQTAYKDNKDIDKQVQVSHLIEPNDDRIPDRQDFENMPYRSIYWETGNNDSEIFLAKRGLMKFPIISPRWDLITTDMVYGYGPGWNALGNVKQLQKTQFDKLMAQEKLHNPPMQQDSAVEHANLLPGGLSKSTANLPNVGIRPAYQIDPKLDSFIQLISELHDSIDKDFYVNLFLMMMSIDQGTMTATEVAERQQEKIMMMGPILHRLDEEMLTPTLELVFYYMSEAGLIPPPPQGLQGELKIQYISILAQAQRSLGTTQIERVVGHIEMAMQADPSIIDVYDFDESLRQIAENEFP